MSKEEAIVKLIPAFRKYGYEGASLTLLSKATGLGKASLYHYFPGGKSEMAAAVFEYVDSDFSKSVLKTLQRDGEPIVKIQAACLRLRQFYNSGRNSCFLAIMSFGEADKLFHDKVKARLELVIDSLAKVLVEAGIEKDIATIRAQDAIAQIQGALVLVRILDDTEPFERVIEGLPGRLLG
ncbi:transcriptional regulator [Rivularia sp. PCC 7116]|uniref:TetR/AcrR family transcriptional regulator n=1 Tax=Rivularia sp. PCC 7116 TaxID=373994 RepID=UPI00029F04B5|nr:TetR/AcrR family transcriptional regulator [Rivularia sp. PCC 7116]AFY57619.1 transcriptional regulator [Rivularia sp. PCC 7116]